MFFDSTYMIVLPALVLALYAQFKVRSTFGRYSEVPTAAGRTGAEVAAEILRRRGIVGVRIEPVEGMLADHYDPRTRTLRLSPQVYASPSVAAVGVAAHECGHALQHAERYAPLAARSAIVPLATIGTNAAWILFLIGMLTSTRYLMDLGILLFTGYIAFSLITLPVEFDASRRAVQVLQGEGLVMPREADGVRSVLGAAALTYVAAAAMAVLQLVRLVMLRNMRESD
ncbi:MAG: zinc metallopeptidase [Armatimonadota bacterium]|nr:zinc metallopeptidase [Armatimonadota bacterium]